MRESWSENREYDKQDQNEVNNQAPKTYQDRMKYERKNNFEYMPTEALSQIKAILNADTDLLPMPYKASSEPAPREEPSDRPTSTVSKTTKKKQGGADRTTTSAQHAPAAQEDSHLSSSLPPSRKLQIQGGKVRGGNKHGAWITGGRVDGGSIEGGSISGGNVRGGVFRNGNMENGTLYNGTVDGGTMKGGEMYGGKMTSGSIEGGTFRGGSIDGGKLVGGEMDGGSLKSGAVMGGFLRNGSVEGGILKGGSIEGGHLLGGVMLGGHLKGGIVKSGIIRGGTIEGGVVEGGVIEDGVVIKGGYIRGYDEIDPDKLTGDKFIRTKDDLSAELKKKGQRDQQQAEEAALIETTKPETPKKLLDNMYKIDVEPQEQGLEPQHEQTGDTGPGKPTEGKSPNNINVLGSPESWPLKSKDMSKTSDSSKPKVAPVTYANTIEQQPKTVAVKQEPNRDETKMAASTVKLRALLNDLDRAKGKAAFQQKQDLFKVPDSKVPDTDEFMGAPPYVRSKTLAFNGFKKPTPNFVNFVNANDDSFGRKYWTTTRTIQGNFH